MIAAYRPCSLSVETAAFARRVTDAAAPSTAARAKALLFAAGKLASFAQGVGLPLDETLLSTAVIECFIASGAAGGPATRRTLRTNLRALGRALAVAPCPAFGPRHLVSGPNPKSHNVTNPLLRSLSGGGDLPHLDTGRLRSTYLAAMAETIGLRAFMDAAGITCSQRLGDLVAGLLPRGEEEVVALLGGRR